MPKRVSIVVFRECDPSIIYGVFDTLWAAGRFFKVPPWKGFEARIAGEPLFEPRILAAEHGPLELITAREPAQADRGALSRPRREIAPVGDCRGCSSPPSSNAERFLAGNTIPGIGQTVERGASREPILLREDQ